jgi:formylmethanofuran dehydrogenase subunit C
MDWPGMTRGKISIDGNAGMHLGAYMKGGTIEVSGAASIGSAARCPAG